MHDVLQSIVRQVNQSNVLAAMDAERSRRIASDARFAVCEELRRKVVARDVATSVAAEQQARVDAGPIDATMLPRALFEVNAEIESMANRTTAIMLEQVGQAEAMHARAMHVLCEELERAGNRKAAAAASDAEGERRTAEAWMWEVTHELRRTYNARIADAAALVEQAERITSPVDFADVSATKHEINRDIEHLGSVQMAAEQVATARSEIAHNHLMLSLCEELERTVARNGAKAAANDEQTERIATEWMHEVAAQIRSTTARQAAKVAVAQEQALRCAEDSYWVADLSAIVDRKQGINSDIVRRGGAAEAATAAVVARAERTHEHTFVGVCEEIRRSVARTAVVAAMETEQAQRITADVMHAVVEEVRRDFGRRQAAVAAANEQQARVESGVHRTYWVVDAPSIADTKADMNNAVERAGNVKRARADAATARAEKVHEYCMDAVCEGVRRAVAQSNARAAADDEKAERMTIEQIHAVAEDLRRTHARKRAKAAQAKEQRARVESGIQRTYWVVDTPTIANTKSEVNAEVERRGNRVHVLELMEAERSDRVHGDTLAAVTEEVRRYVAQRLANAAMADESAHATTRKAFEAVAFELVGRVHRRDARDAFTVEQEAQMAHPTSPSSEFDQRWREVLGSVCESPFVWVPKVC
jgi:hypothetical protein